MRTCYERWELCLPVTMVCIKAYIVAMKINHMERGILRSVLFALAFPPFIIIDLLYTFTLGAYIYKEFPKVWIDWKEIMWTYVTKRIGVSGTDEQKVVHDIVKPLLNKYSPGHV